MEIRPNYDKIGIKELKASELKNLAVLILNSYLLLRRYKANKGLVFEGKKFQALWIKLNAPNLWKIDIEGKNNFIKISGFWIHEYTFLEKYCFCFTKVKTLLEKRNEGTDTSIFHENSWCRGKSFLPQISDNIEDEYLALSFRF